MATLILERGDGSKQVFPLEKKVITLGRDGSNQVVLADPSVSRVHARITPSNGTYVLKDMESTNGVFLNGEPCREERLRDGDKIRLGNSTLVFAEKSEGAAGSLAGAFIPFAEISLPMFKAKQDVTLAGKGQNMLMAFFRLSRVLKPDGNFKDVVKDALVQVLEALKGDTAMVFLSHSEKGMLEPFLAVQGHEGIPFHLVEYSRTLLKKVMESGEAILTSNAMADERFEGAASVVSSRIHSAMCVPLRTMQHTFGVLQVDARSPQPGFSKEHLEMLSVLAKEMAVYLENIKLRKDLKGAKEKLDGLEAARSKFVGVLGYQIATPVTIMDQYFRLLGDGLLGPIAPRQKEALEILQRHSQRLKYIVRDLERVLSWDVIFKKLKSAMEEFDMQEVADSVVQEVKPLFAVKNQQFSWHRNAHPTKLMGNKDALREVFANLLINAYKFTPEGSEISLAMEEDADTVLVRVGDNGIGLAPEILAHLFESFYVGDENLAFAQAAPKHLSRSLGLGLFLSKRIVEGHNGKIWAESELGKYTRFYFSLPKKQPKVES